MTLITARLSLVDRALIIDGFAEIAGVIDDLGAKVADLGAKVDSLTTLTQTIGDSEMALMDDLETKLSNAEGAQQREQILLDTIHQELVDMISSGATPMRLQALADRIDGLAQSATDTATRDPDPAAPAGP